MMANGDPAAIQTRGLSKRYRKVTALSEATIAVPEGRVSALIGPNGAGKTTLLRLLAGLARATSGEVAVLGSAPTQDPAFLADVGFLVPQTWLAACGLRQEHAKRRSALEMTDRETEVAHLIERGMTNAEIAAELFITPKAVEYHLGNIYAKFGLKGRQQLRRLLTDSRRPAPA